MIAFNNNYNNQDPLKKLEDIIYKIYENDSSLTSFLDDDLDFADSDLSELLEVVYFHLFTENYSSMDISISKDKNQSLTIKINNLE